jgi:AraC-like DNA-binding protein
MFAAALVNEPRARARLVETLRGKLDLKMCESCSELRDLALSAGVSIVITEPVDRFTQATWPVVAEIRRVFPGLPLVGYCSMRSSLSGDIVDLVRAGVHDIAVLDVDDSIVGLRAKLSKARTIGTAEWAFIELEPLLTPAMTQVVQYGLSNAFRASTVSELAAVLGVNRKTLVNWCRAAGAPPPGNVLSWCRLLMVARLLEESERSIEHIALELGFPTSGALRAMLRRYTLLNPQRLRAAGSSRYMLDLLKAALSQELASRAGRGATISRTSLRIAMVAIMTQLASEALRSC